MTDDELDAAIATDVMGWAPGWRANPATDIADAFEVVERMRSLGFRVNLYLPAIPGKPACYVGSKKEGPFVAKNASLPRAICEAALDAVRSTERAGPLVNK